MAEAQPEAKTPRSSAPKTPPPNLNTLPQDCADLIMIAVGSDLGELRNNAHRPTTTHRYTQVWRAPRDRARVVRRSARMRLT